MVNPSMVESEASFQFCRVWPRPPRRRAGTRTGFEPGQRIPDAALTGMLVVCQPLRPDQASEARRSDPTVRGVGNHTQRHACRLGEKSTTDAQSLRALMC